MSGWGIFIIVLVIVVVFGAVGWVIYAHYRARRLGLPAPSLNPFARNNRDTNTTYRPPAPASGGIGGWVRDKVSALRNTRTTTGGYESTGYGGGSSRAGRRGFGALDPDEAWDTRVGNEADYYGSAPYEEQELGETGHGAYGGGGYGGEAGAGVGVGGIPDERGRSRSRQRELDARYDEEMHGGAKMGSGRANPFGDEHEAGSLRAVSPRPHGERSRSRGISSHTKGQNSLGAGRGSAESSPTERRSVFREDM